MADYKPFFKGKKVTVMGLGLLGRGVGDAAFLAECGAELTVTDLKPSAGLRPSLEKLRTYKNIKFVLGRHRLEDFRGKDMILKAAGVPLDSPYIKEARKNKIPVEMSATLFAKLSGIPLIGVTGTRGKSTVTHLIAHILKFAGKKVILGGNVRGVSNLQLLKKARNAELAVFELDSWQLQAFGEAKISPNISVFTSFLSDHMNYYGSTSLTTSKKAMKRYFNDKANIFKYQKRNDVLIIRPGVKKLVPKNLKSKLMVVKPDNFQEENKACAVEVAKQFKIQDFKIAQALKNFKGLEGRLQYVKTVKGVKIYNDNNATTPEATIAGIEALSDVGRPNRTSNVRKIALICGGADKKLPLDDFVKVVNKYCKAVIMIPGTGTDRFSSKKLKVESYKVENLKNAVKTALGLALHGNIVLFSPAFASFGQFNNEYERGDLFMKIIKKLK